jgi:hypothetical protein
MRRRLAMITVLTLGLLPVWAPPAPTLAAGAVTLGQVATAADTPVNCGTGTMYVQDSTGGGTPYLASAGGVVTSWSMYAPSTPTAVAQLKLVREGPPDTYVVRASAQRRRLVTAGLNTFPTRLPIAAGDSVAVYVGDVVLPCAFLTSAAADTFRFNNAGPGPEPIDGDAVVTTVGAGNVRLNLAVQVEPDADGDGYGDVTQDLCPTRATAQGDCTAPDTGFGKVKRKVSVKGHRATVQVPLTSTEAGSTFTCAVDAKKPAPCTSPVKLRLKVGTHVVHVTATDPAGNTDATAAVVSIKVRKAKGS